MGSLSRSPGRRQLYRRARSDRQSAVQPPLEEPCPQTEQVLADAKAEAARLISETEVVRLSLANLAYVVGQASLIQGAGPETWLIPSMPGGRSDRRS